MKQCNVCNNTQPLENFHRTKSFKDGRSYTCKSCAKTRAMKWNKANKDHKKEQGKKHYLENKEKYLKRAAKAEWSKKNPERIKQLAKKRYHKNNGASVVAYYRNLRRKATPTWLTDVQKSEIENFYWLCRDLEKITTDRYHVDHIVPIKGECVCGLHVPWNLQVLPADINIKKSNTFGY